MHTQDENKFNSANLNVYREAAFFLGTFPPASLASDKPIAMACFLLVTFFFERPDFNLPSFISWRALATF